MSRVRAHSARLAALAALVAGVAWADQAQAWSFKDRYQEPVGWGGGGGRFFTGSPIDGFACNVCHQGGPEPRVQVNGLPEGYAPGRLYDIEVVFQDVGPAVRHGLHLEFVGRDGRAAGTLRLIDERQVDAAARCLASATEPPADYELVTEGRKVLGVEPCGATHMRFRFGPPDTPDVSFSMSVVASDRGGSVEGDGVFNFKKVLRRQGEPAPKSAGCSLGSRASARSMAGELSCTLGSVLAALWIARRRVRRH